MEGRVVLHFYFFSSRGCLGFDFLGFCWRRKEGKEVILLLLVVWWGSYCW